MSFIGRESRGDDNGCRIIVLWGSAVYGFWSVEGGYGQVKKGKQGNSSILHVGKELSDLLDCSFDHLCINQCKLNDV